MRLSLIELLRERPIVHPTTIVRAVLEPDVLTVSVEGCAWWLDSQSLGRLTLAFRGLGPGSIDLELVSAYDEALEDLAVNAVADVDWARSPALSIFCYAPLPDPGELYRKVQDYLAAIQAYVSVADILNSAETLRGFEMLASSPSFMVARCSEGLRALICDELKAQGVQHNVVRVHDPQDTGFVVTLAASIFRCEEAWAEFEA